MDLMQEIRGVVARGYCFPPNTEKECDADLLEAIASEVVKWIRENNLKSAFREHGIPWPEKS
jgi:hypothetical protein